MTGNQMFCRENELDESFKQLASYINIPVGVLLPFKSQCFVRHYNKGQIVYYSSDETTHIYLLLTVTPNKINKRRILRRVTIFYIRLIRCQPKYPNSTLCIITGQTTQSHV